MVNGEKAELFNMSVNLWDPYVDITIDKIKSMAQGIEEDIQNEVQYNKEKSVFRRRKCCTPYRSFSIERRT